MKKLFSQENSGFKWWEIPVNFIGELFKQIIGELLFATPICIGCSIYITWGTIWLLIPIFLSIIFVTMWLWKKYNFN